MQRYANFEKVGEGAFGLVFRARDVDQGKVVAVKRVSRTRAEEGASFATLREIKLLMELNHPSIVRYVTKWGLSYETAQLSLLR